MADTDHQDLISRGEAESLFTPYFPALADCLLTGWGAWETIRGTAEGRTLGKSARARIVWDHATARAEALFGPVDHIGKGRRHGLLVLDFTRALLRFKKLDNQLKTRGIPTGQQVLLANQGQTVVPEQLMFWPRGPMVVAGYVLNRVESGIERLVLVLARRGEVLWDIDIPAARVVEMVPVPIEEPAAATVRSTRRSSEEAGTEAQ